MEFKVANAPNFFIIGAAKAGTTTLYSILIQHPDIFLPKDKEPRFFDSDNYYKRGVEAYLHNHFAGAEHYSARGEATPHYLSHHITSAPRMLQAFGKDLKFIAILRDPVKRAWSHYLHQLRNGGEKHPFLIALEREMLMTEEERPAWTNYFDDGLYAKHIMSWLDYFHREQFLFLFTEDLADNAEGVARTVFDFLGVNAEIPINFSARENIAGQSRYAWLGSLLNRPNRLTNVLKQLFPYVVRQRIRETINSWNRKPFVAAPTLDKDVENKLRREYASDIIQLEKITGRDLSRWKGGQ